MKQVDSKALLEQLIRGEDLDGATMEALVGAIMDKELPEPVIGAFLVALRMKGETGVEVAAAGRAMRARALRVPVRAADGAVDTCGTGGDGADTVNISTAAALVAAAGGVKVAKHGNRSVSSRCGSADVLEDAGVRLDLDAERLAVLFDELGIAFLFAPRLHPAMGAVMPARRALRLRTTFNLLGPLTNPAGVSRQVVGVWGPEVQELVAEALAELGAEHALVVHSEDGLDELSVCAPTAVVEVRGGRVVGHWTVTPEELGLDACAASELAGGDVACNTRRLREILSGRDRSAAREAVALNAAAAFLVAGRVGDLQVGMTRARELMDAGTPRELLTRLAARSQELARA